MQGPHVRHMCKYDLSMTNVIAFAPLFSSGFTVAYSFHHFPQFARFLKAACNQFDNSDGNKTETHPFTNGKQISSSEAPSFVLFSISLACLIFSLRTTSDEM